MVSAKSLRGRRWHRISLSAALLLCTAFAHVLYAQGVDSALNFAETLAGKVTKENAAALLAEIDHFLGAYHGDPEAQGHLLGLRGIVLARAEKPREAAISILRAKAVFGFHSTETYAAFTKVLGAKTGILRKAAFTEQQVKTLSGVYDEDLQSSLPLWKREQYLLSRLREIVEPGLTGVFVQEADWYLSHVPVENASDSCRFWLGEVLSQLGDHYRAWETFYSVIRLYPKSDLVPLCYRKAATELETKPLWDFSGALALLDKYLQLFPSREDRGEVFWEAAQVAVRKLKDPFVGSTYVDSLLHSYSTEVRDPEIVFELGQQFMKKRDYDRAERYLNEFIKAYPSNDRVKDAKKLLRRVRVEKARPG